MIYRYHHGLLCGLSFHNSQHLPAFFWCIHYSSGSPSVSSGVTFARLASHLSRPRPSALLARGSDWLAPTNSGRYLRGRSYWVCIDHLETLRIVAAEDRKNWRSSAAKTRGEMNPNLICIRNNQHVCKHNYNVGPTSNSNNCEFWRVTNMHIC